MTDRVVRASEVSGLPVVSIGSGEDIAEIKDVVFDGSQHRLIGFTLNKRGWFRGSLKQVLSADSVAAIGPHAVMVLQESDIQESANPPALVGHAETHSVLHNRVISSDGTDLGEIVGVILTTGDDPEAVGYEIDSPDSGSSFVPILAQLALSDNNLLIPAEANQFITNDLAGFGASVQLFRAPLDEASTLKGAGE